MYRRSCMRRIGAVGMWLGLATGTQAQYLNPFVLALPDPTAYAAEYPDCDILLADCNGDGVVDFGDINAFVALLSGR